MIVHVSAVMAWHCGSMLVSINELILCWNKIVLESMTIFGGLTISVSSPANSASYPRWDRKWVWPKGSDALQLERHHLASPERAKLVSDCSEFPSPLWHRWLSSDKGIHPKTTANEGITSVYDTDDGKMVGWLVDWGLMALSTQVRSYRAFKVKTIL